MSEILKGNTDIEASSIWTGITPAAEPMPTPHYPPRQMPPDPPAWCRPCENPKFIDPAPGAILAKYRAGLLTR